MKKKKKTASRPKTKARKTSTATEKVSSDVAKISLIAGRNFYEIAQVKASGREENLLKAIEAYKRALSFYTLEGFPQDYAMTQNNLGNAYWGFSEVRDKEDNLGLAIKAYNEALRVLTKEALPWYFVETSENLAKALYTKGDKAGTSKVIEEMLPVAEEVGYPGLEGYRRFYEGLKSAR